MKIPHGKLLKRRSLACLSLLAIIIYGSYNLLIHIERVPPQPHQPLANLSSSVPCYPTVKKSRQELGKIVLVTFYSTSAADQLYFRPLATIKCYAKRTNTELVVIEDNRRTSEQNQSCPQKIIYFRKHCLIAHALQSRPDIHWAYVLDADTGVANPEHDLTEFIDDRVDLIFYERFFLWEIAAGNYIAKNTNFTRQFLRQWANMEYEIPDPDLVRTSYDNGAIHLLLLRTVFDNVSSVADTCAKLWHSNQYFPYIWCSLYYMRQRRCSTHVRLLRRAHGWAIDRHILEDYWSAEIFMQHGWKDQGWEQTDNGTKWSLERTPTGDECDPDIRASWPLREHLRLKTTNQMRQQLQKQEFLRQRNMFLGAFSDIGNCWPNCAYNDTTEMLFPCHFTKHWQKAANLPKVPCHVDLLREYGFWMCITKKWICFYL